MNVQGDIKGQWPSDKADTLYWYRPYQDKLSGFFIKSVQFKGDVCQILKDMANGFL